VPENALVFFARLLCTALPAALLLILVAASCAPHLPEPVADALTAAYALARSPSATPSSS
jgi:hypothetical protein